MRWHNGFHDITCEEAMRALFLSRCARKAIFVHQAHLTTSMPISTDLQWLHILYVENLWSALSDTGRIEPVSLRQLAICPMKLRESARTALTGQAKALQLSEQFPTCGVDSRCILEGSFGQGFDLLQEIRLFLKEIFDVFGALGSVALLTGKA